MMNLNDEQTAEALVTHVLDGGTFAAFADQYHMDRKTVGRRLKAMPELKRRVDEARYRANHVANNAAKALTASPTSDPAAVPATLAQLREQYLALVWRISNDDESKAQGRALAIMGTYLLGAEEWGARKAAEREGIEETGARTRRVVNVDLPEPGSRRVIDAEVVDT